MFVKTIFSSEWVWSYYLEFCFLENSDVRISCSKCLDSWQVWHWSPTCLLVRVISSLFKALYDRLNKWRKMDLRKSANSTPTKSYVEPLGEWCWTVWKQAFMEQIVQEDRNRETCWPSSLISDSSSIGQWPEAAKGNAGGVSAQPWWASTQEKG